MSAYNQGNLMRSRQKKMPPLLAARPFWSTHYASWRKDFSNLLKNAQVDRRDFSAVEAVPKNIVRMDINYGVTRLRNLEKYYAREVLKKLNGNKTQCARLLGISRPKLDILLKD